MNSNNFSKETLWAVCIITVCILTGCFLIYNTNVKKADFTTQYAIEDTIILHPIDSQISESAVTITDSESIKPVTKIVPSSYQCPIDFDSLWEINEDVYAWITIPGTIIDYPILQHKTDNSYYLNYNMDGTKGFPGCIYTENINSKDFTDNNTVIYGHNLRSGKMFTDLHKFRDTEFFAQNDTVYIYTPEEQLTYKIFAAYLYDDRHLMNSFDFSDGKVYSDYLSEILSMDSEDVNIRKNIKITDTDKIITLITCIREQTEKRVYVQAVLESYN